MKLLEKTKHVFSEIEMFDDISAKMRRAEPLANGNRRRISGHIVVSRRAEVRY